jgi:DMSO/TMAO reductase YedYZ molybdopterin-dependent catalytic subunit
MAIEGKDPRLVPYGDANLGMPLDLVDSLIVPNECFFVRSNGPTPQISRNDWRLAIEGAVEIFTTIGFGTLQSLPRRTITAFLECTGNGRSRFEPEAEGTPWKNDAAGNAVWTGVAVRDVLALAQPKTTAMEIVAQGADLPDMRRGLPMHVALDPNTLLVFEMNGEPLPAAHGGPVRLVVPGWAGIASTKWLSRLDVWEKPFTGHYQGELYVIYDEDDIPVAPVSQMPVKSVIAEPVDGGRVDAGMTEIRGFAWSGYAGIARVEIEIDGSGEWQLAEIVESAGPLSWVRWRCELDLTPGEHTLAARATDERGIQQPRAARWNQKGYLMNAIQTVAVTAGER